MISKPDKPPKHERRYSFGQIIKDRLGLYMAINPKILEDFELNEEVYILGMDTVDDFYNQISYYAELDIYHYQIYEKCFKELTKEIKQLKKLNNNLAKTIIELKDDNGN